MMATVATGFHGFDPALIKFFRDLWFWQGNGPSRERPGYFFRLTDETLILGAGMHAFSDSALARYREAVLNDDQGAQLIAAVKVRASKSTGRHTRRSRLAYLPRIPAPTGCGTPASSPSSSSRCRPKSFQCN
jgi:hypothetical protein